MDIVTATGLKKDYNGVSALRGIDFAIREGECFGFLGPNGAGKTTAMGIVHCYMPPTAGEVRVFGMDVNEKPSEIKGRLGVMPQEDNLDPDLSVIENLIVYARYFDIPKGVSKPRALKLLKFIDIEEKANTKIEDLSGGMKRRTMLARALMNEPELLILDEPTTGLDPHSRRSVWEKLENLKSNNTTIILTTHYMEEAEQVCDRVAIMDLGKILTTDSPGALMDKHGGNLENVYLKLTGRSLSSD